MVATLVRVIRVPVVREQVILVLPASGAGKLGGELISKKLPGNGVLPPPRWSRNLRRDWCARRCPAQRGGRARPG